MDGLSFLLSLSVTVSVVSLLMTAFCLTKLFKTKAEFYSYFLKLAEISKEINNRKGG